MRQWNQLFGALIAGSALLVTAPQQAAANSADIPGHLKWAERLVDTTPASRNEYASPAEVSWKHDTGKAYSSNTSKCASFVTQTLVRAYKTDFKKWFGCDSPNAKSYHDKVEDEDGFKIIHYINDVRPGDLLAIEYLDRGCKKHTCGTVQNCSSSGHMAIVASKPVLATATKPIVKGTLQYTVEVVDSSGSYHGKEDTRYQSEKNNKDDTGVGRGTMRLYVDANDSDRPVIGYAWSTSSASTFYGSKKRDLLIGRYNKK